MKSYFQIWILVATLLFSQANTFAMGGKPAKVEPPVERTPEPTPPVETPAGGTATQTPQIEEGLIHFSPAKGYTKDELEVLAIAETLANGLVKTKCFANFMEKRGLIQTEGKSAENVVLHLRTAKLTVPVTMYYKNNNVVGYRQPPALTIFTNRKFHAGSTACARGSNLTHEWSHSLGYSHDFNASKSRPRSVPYSINGAYTECCSCKGIRDCKLKE